MSEMLPAELPSKKQLEVLRYIEGFINENGFGPSYREIMRALDLKSPSTVASHVNGLIARGYLIKRTNSARSLQVVQKGVEQASSITEEEHLDWLRLQIKKRELSEELSKEAAILKAALQLLDQTDKE